MTERPDRYRNAIVPHIYVDGASDAIAFYTRAFGAAELFRVAHPDVGFCMPRFPSAAPWP
jgi:PhnB protein